MRLCLLGDLGLLPFNLLPLSEFDTLPFPDHRRLRETYCVFNNSLPNHLRSTLRWLDTTQAMGICWQYNEYGDLISVIEVKKKKKVRSLQFGRVGLVVRFEAVENLEQCLLVPSALTGAIIIKNVGGMRPPPPKVWVGICNIGR